MLKEIQKEVEDLRVKVYAGQSLEDTEKALYEIEQILLKAMDKQLIIPIVSNRRELLIAYEITKHPFLAEKYRLEYATKLVDKYLKSNYFYTVL